VQRVQGRIGWKRNTSYIIVLRNTKEAETLAAVHNTTTAKSKDGFIPASLNRRSNFVQQIF